MRKVRNRIRLRKLFDFMITTYILRNLKLLQNVVSFMNFGKNRC